MSFEYLYDTIFRKRFIVIVLLLLCPFSTHANNERILKNKYVDFTDSTHQIFQAPTDSINNTVKFPKKTYFKSTKEGLRIAKEVIRRKNELSYHQQSYCNFDIYDKLMFAWSNFKPDHKYFRHWPFLKQYTDTSVISKHTILPLAMYESYATKYYQRSPAKRKLIVHGRKIYGMSDELDTEDACEDLIKLLEKADIKRDNQRLFFNKIISPLNKKRGTNFYRWIVLDTVTIQGKPYINLCFRPSKIVDLGFMGNLYISTDGNYALKRSVIKISKAININYVKELVIYQDFIELPQKNIWVPSRASVVSKLSAFGLVKSYFEFGRTYQNFQFEKAPDSIYTTRKGTRYDKGYLNRDSLYWNQKRSITFTKHQHEYQSDSIANQIMSIPLVNLSIKTINLLSNNYIPLGNNRQEAKISLGTFDSFYSNNSIEGSRIRLTAITSAKLFPHLFFKTYGAYGFKDKVFKYSTKATWAFNHPLLYSEEFPKNNLSLTCEYDLNVLGENYAYQKRDNIIYAFLHYRHLQRMTYAHRIQLNYEKEYKNGLSFSLQLKSQKETPAGNLEFKTYDLFGQTQNIDYLQTTEVSSILRYATKERFYVRSDQRKDLPAERFVVSLTHILGLNDFLGGQYHYNRLQLHIIKEHWLASFGKIKGSVKLEKVWGSLPYPLLLAPNANNSYTIQRESFSLISPLEFINDKQISWDIDYYCKGCIMRRIPLIKKLHLREVIGISGFIGTLSQRNKPSYDHSLFIFPDNTHPMSDTPYLEVNIGLRNIFRILRVDYVKRLTYLKEARKKDGLRISIHLDF